MTNKCETDYPGPTPKSINPTYPDHTYDTIVCLINGELKRIIQDRYLRKFGYTKQSYLEKYPGAPVKSQAATNSYRNAALNDGGRRSSNLTKLNLTNADFQYNRKKKHNEFLQSDRSIDYREASRQRAKQQHINGQAKYVQEYFATRYQGSNDQKDRSKRMTGKNNIIHLPGVVKKGKETYIKNHNSGFHATTKQQFKNYNLQYQSSYEYHFLEYCEAQGYIHLISKPNALRDGIYPRRYYLPDYILNSKYVVEIKSRYIEARQLAINPNVTIEKQNLVERLGYKWLYILDKNYTELDLLV